MSSTHQKERGGPDLSKLLFYDELDRKWGTLVVPHMLAVHVGLHEAMVLHQLVRIMEVNTQDGWVDDKQCVPLLKGSLSPLLNRQIAPIVTRLKEQGLIINRTVTEADGSKKLQCRVDLVAVQVLLGSADK